MSHRKLTDQDRAEILALKGHVTAPGVAAKYGVAQNTVYAIWQQRYRAGVLGRPKRPLTPELREQIIEMKASGLRTRDVMAATGFGECTVLLVMREARAEGDPRATKAQPPKPEPVHVPLPPRMTVRMTERAARMRDSFKARGMSHEMATREALRICAASNAIGGALGGACVAGGGGGGVCASFHAQSMEEASQ